MATMAATAPRTRQAVSPGIWLPAYSLWLARDCPFLSPEGPGGGRDCFAADLLGGAGRGLRA